MKGIIVEDIRLPRLMLNSIRGVYSFYKHQEAKIRIRNLIKAKQEIWLDVGNGDTGKDGWITVDITKNCDIFWDLRRGLPFPDESISKIYSSHFLEHLSFRAGQRFLEECLRVLVPSGTFSICVPDARLYIEAYLKGSPLDDFCKYRPAYNNTTKIDYVNYMAYMDGHHNYMFDEENLLFILKSAGFRNVHVRQFNPDLDIKQRDYESIYAEAEK